ncbi:MAG: hypothetical protein A2Z72_06230 [Omnitrophica bacterium RBG_13_46_9]|nr:MAG: hypothetical protein A2Z72_06230 [Omnitrophica bacterium RBG_13_46_9]
MREVDVNKLKLRKAHVDDIDIAYKTFGKGYPIVLIMGFSGTMDMWEPRVLRALSSHYKVIVFDSRGIGESTATSKKFSIELFADDTAGLLDALGIERAHILGWSMGTNIAQELALRHPDKVDKLILYAADPGGKECVQPESPLKTVTDTSGTLHDREERVVKVLFPEEWRKKHPDVREYFPFPKERSSVDNVNRQAQAMNEWAGSYSRLGQIKCPTLLITGTEDVIPPPINSFIMGEKIPGAWVIQIKGGGHGLMYQYPEGFSRAILTFLESEND